MSKSIAKGVFYLVAVVLFLWTASLSYSFVSSVLPDAHWAVPLLALVVLDAGMIAWLFVFLYHAEGTAQRAIALTMCVFDLIGVGLIAGGEILLGGQTLATVPAFLGEWAVYGLALWTIGNVAAVIAFHLASPAARKAMLMQAEKDAVIAEALERLKAKRTAVSGQLSDSLAETMLTELIAELAMGEGHNIVSDNDIMSSNEPANPTPTAGQTIYSMNQDGEPVPDIVSRK